MNIRCVHIVQPTPNSERSKPFIVMQTFFKMLQIIFCLDFGFFEHETVNRRLFWKITTILQSICMISLSFIFYSDYGYKLIIWISHYYCHYFLNVILLISLSPNRTLCHLHRHLQIIDMKLQASSFPFHVEQKIILYIIFEFVYNFIINVYYSKIPYLACKLLHFWIVLSRNIVYLCSAFVFYCILCRLKMLVSILKSDDRNSSLLQYNRIYKTIVELTKLYKSALDPLVSYIGVIINIART